MATRGRPRGSGVNQKHKRTASAPAAVDTHTGSKKTKREQPFLPSYTEAYPCIVPSTVDKTSARCTT